MKCLPQNKLSSANGLILHDWHAEVLAIRSFNHFVLQECKAILATENGPKPYESPYLHRRTNDDVERTNGKEVDDNDGCQKQQQPFVWKDNVTLHMYCSEAPCGDASMELTMSAQEDASPWESPLPPRLLAKANSCSSSSSSFAATENPQNQLPSPPSSTPDLLLLGRACFSHLGVVRRKPARPDAPPTLSKSCSDKLALRQCTSLLNSVVSFLVSPRGVYLRSLILPESQYSATGCERCFSPKGRMVSLIVDSGNATEEEEEYAFRPFDIATTSLEFPFSRRGGGDGVVEKYVASSLSTAWSINGLAENIIGGVLQGRKQSDPRGGSQVSRAKMWDLARHVADMVAAAAASVGDAYATTIPSAGTYQELKESSLLDSRRLAKVRVIEDALMGWVKNVGDDRFNLSP